MRKSIAFFRWFKRKFLIYSLKFSWLIVFFAVLTPLKIVQGQPYESITQNDSITYTFNRPPRARDYTFGTIREKTFSDSTYSFRGQSYKKLVAQDTFERELKTIYVREDTSEGKLWALNITDLANENGYDTSEHLVMDLSLNKNDSFKVPYGRFSWELKSPYVQADSVFSINGHKVIYFDIRDRTVLNVSEIIFIEGVGPTMGFYVDPSQKDTYTFAGTKELRYNALVCAKEKEIANYSLLQSIIYSVKSSIFNYSGDWSRQCLEPRTVGGVGVNDLIKKGRSVKIYPQPAQEKVSFEVNQSVNQSILRIYTMKGEMVLQKRIQERKFQIEKPNQNRVYFYQILEQGEGLIKSGKILFY